MDVGKYELLLKAVEFQNLTKAASALGYTQSGASHVISSIENELGVSLLRRDHRGTALTTEGEMMLPAIREMVACGEKIRAISQSILGLQIGVLRVAAFSSISLLWVPRMIAQFHRKYPNVQVEIVSGTGSYEEMEAYLLTARVDCSFVRLPGTGTMQCTPLLHDPLLAVLPPMHPLANAPEPIRFSQLTAEPFLMPTEGKNYDIRTLFKTFSFEPQVAFTMHDDLSLLAMAENGLGWTILPGLQLNHYTHKAAVKRLETNPYRLIGVATRASQTPSPLVTAFVELALQMAQEFTSKNSISIEQPV